MITQTGSLTVNTNPQQPFLPCETQIKGEWNEWIAKLQYAISFELDIATVSKSTLECKFPFPLSVKNNCICHSSLLLQKWSTESNSWEKEDYIVGKVEEKQVAKETYQDAIVENKKSSFLLKEDENQVTVETFLSGLTVGSKYRFTLDLHYMTQAQVTLQEEDGVEYWMTLPLRFLKGGKVHGNIQVIQPVEKSLFAPSHASHFQLQSSQIEFQFDKVDQELSLPLSLQTKNLKQSLQNNHLQQNNSHEMISIEKKNDNSYAMMIPIITPSDIEADERNEVINTEFIFVIDCSGSMYGQPLHDAVRTMKLFLQSLPLNQGIRINVTRFGSSFESVYKECQLLNDKTYKEVSTYIDQTDNKDLGGTNLYSPLDHILLKMKQEPGYTKQVIILTDGELNDKQVVLNLVKSNEDKARIFTIGIGSCDRNLVRELAQFGNGYCEIVEYGEKIEPKVINHLKKALKPALTECKLEFNTTDKSLQINPCYITIPPLFYGSIFVAIAMCNQMPTKANLPTVKFTSKVSNSKEFCKTFALKEEDQVVQSNAIHLFGSWKKMEELWQIQSNPKALQKYNLNASEVCKQIIALSLESQILSKLTGYVAVSDATSQQAIQEAPKTVEYNVLEDMKSYSPSLRITSSSFSAAPAPKPSFFTRVKSAFTGKGAVANTSSKMSLAPAPVSSSAPIAARSRAFTPVEKSKKKKDSSMKKELVMDLMDDALECSKCEQSIVMSRDIAPLECESASLDCDDEVCALEEELNISFDAPAPAPIPAYSAPPIAQASRSTSQQKSISKPKLSIDALLFTQNPNGSWSFDSKLQQFVKQVLAAELSWKNSEIEDILKKWEQELGKGDLMGTIVAVALLQKFYMDQKSEWELIEKKAIKFIKSNGKANTDISTIVSQLL